MQFCEITHLRTLFPTLRKHVGYQVSPLSQLDAAYFSNDKTTHTQRCDLCFAFIYMKIMRRPESRKNTDFYLRGRQRRCKYIRPSVMSSRWIRAGQGHEER